MCKFSVNLTSPALFDYGEEFSVKVQNEDGTDIPMPYFVTNSNFDVPETTL